MIKLRDIDVAFAKQSVLKGFCADIPTDGNTAIFGASGSGKTTLLRVLLGLQKPDSGVVTGAEKLRMSAVFQEDRLLPWLTARENVALVADPGCADAHLAALGLAEAMHAMPAQLSGGMKRRVAIARALAFGGDMLLLDEPFNGLDAEAKSVAARAILANGRPVVVITHNRDEAKLLQTGTEILL